MHRRKGREKGKKKGEKCLSSENEKIEIMMKIKIKITEIGR